MRNTSRRSTITVCLKPKQPFGTTGSGKVLDLRRSGTSQSTVLVEAKLAWLTKHGVQIDVEKVRINRRYQSHQRKFSAKLHPAIDSHRCKK